MFSALPGYEGGGNSGLDPVWANVVLALHGDGTNGSTTIVDSKNGYTPNATYLGGVAISTTQSKFGGASIRFPANGGLIYANASADANFQWPGDFCIRAWVYFDASPTGWVIFDSRNSAGASVGFVFYVDASTQKLNLYSGTTFLYTGATAFPTNQWVHVAVSRSGSTMRVFQKGALMGAFTNGSNFSAGYCAIGDVNHSYSNPQATWSGYMDDIEIVKGQALYTAAYTPPIAAFPNS